jgi:hypothetical protein
MKKLAVILAIFVSAILAAGAVIFVFRFDIIRSAIQNAVYEGLPPYIKVSDVDIDVAGGRLDLEGIRIIGPGGGGFEDLCKVPRLTFIFSVKGGLIPREITVTEIMADSPEVFIEIGRRGETNLQGFSQKFIEASGEEKNLMKKDGGEGGTQHKKNFLRRTGEWVISNIKGRLMPDGPVALFDITDTVDVRSATVLVRDNRFTEPVVNTMERIHGSLRFIFDDAYTELLEAETRGEGAVNGYPDQILKWESKLQSFSPSLTMSNSFTLSNINIVPFKPYYDRYLPIEIQKCRVSGECIVNFEEGRIGSQNVLELSGLLYSRKSKSQASQHWKDSVDYIIKYFQNSSSNVVFDFKVKGSIEDPQLLLGPRVKRGLQDLAISTVVQTIDAFSREQGTGKEAEQDSTDGAGDTVTPGDKRPKSDAEKVMDIINIFLDDGK